VQSAPSARARGTRYWSPLGTSATGVAVLTAKQRQYLRGLAHGLDPLVQVGSKGISDALIAQIRDQLEAHELIKVRFNTECAVEPGEVVDDVVTRTRCQLVQKAGRVLILYRRHDEKPRIELPKPKRAPNAA
jgi:RNA-binding protein